MPSSASTVLRPLKNNAESTLREVLLLDLGYPLWECTAHLALVLRRVGPSPLDYSPCMPLPIANADQSLVATTKAPYISHDDQRASCRIPELEVWNSTRSRSMLTGVPHRRAPPPWSNISSSASPAPSVSASGFFLQTYQEKRPGRQFPHRALQTGAARHQTLLCRDGKNLLSPGRVLVCRSQWVCKH